MWVEYILITSCVLQKATKSDRSFGLNRKIRALSLQQVFNPYKNSINILWNERNFP